MEQRVFVVTVEASGEVTTAQPDGEAADVEEVEQ